MVFFLQDFPTHAFRIAPMRAAISHLILHNLITVIMPGEKYKLHCEIFPFLLLLHLFYVQYSPQKHLFSDTHKVGLCVLALRLGTKFHTHKCN